MLIRRQFPDLQLEDMLPALDELIYARYDRFPEQYSQIYRMMSSNRSIEQTSEMSGLGLFGEVSEGADVTYDAAVPGFSKTYLHLQYGLGFKISRLMVDDDRWATIDKMTAALGRSAKETREIIGALTFNRGFNSAYQGPDSKALFATDHPLPKSGGTQSNTLAVAADLDVDSLQLALTQFRKMVDINGHKIRLKPKRLIVAADNEFGAVEILGGDKRSDTANNTTNAFKKRVGMPSFDEIFIWDYLEDPDAWFIQADKGDTELRWYDREKFSTLHDVDFNSRSIKTAGWMRFCCGWSSFYGIFGVPGA
jgi:phage major head subunit gpT-like protein